MVTESTAEISKKVSLIRRFTRSIKNGISWFFKKLFGVVKEILIVVVKIVSGFIGLAGLSLLIISLIPAAVINLPRLRRMFKRLNEMDLKGKYHDFGKDLKNVISVDFEPCL